MNSDSLIYLDYSATTPVDPKVLEVMTPFFTENFGNSASRNHAFGWVAEEAVEKARAQVASLIGADLKEIIFTSGATESNNLAMEGTVGMYGARKGKHIITCVTEHKAVLDPAYYLETQGCEITFLPVNEHGAISMEELKAAIREDTVLISIMAVNNEIGNVHPIAQIGALAHQKGIIFHTDATQAAGKMPIDVNAMHIDLLSLSGHKLYGPKGVGALYVRRRNPRVRLAPKQHGGGHERGMRSGTLNVPGIVGLGAACALAQESMDKENTEIVRLRKKLLDGISEHVDYISINGDPEHYLPGILNISFNYIEGESLMMGIDNIAVSSGSACTSASLEPSYVLRAMGVGDEAAHSSIRFSIGRFTTDAEIDRALDKIVGVVQKLREMSPLYEMVKEGIDLDTIEWTGH